MIRRVRVAAATAALIALAGCGTGPSDLVVVGTVDDTVQTVMVPALAAAAVDLDAGFATESSSADPPSGLGFSGVAQAYGLGSVVRVSEVLVAEGDAVAPGQVLARVDDGQLPALLAVAKADQKVAAAQVGLLRDAIEETLDKESDIEDAKQDVSEAIDKLRTNRAKLQNARSALKKARADLVKKLHALQDLLANYPPVVPPGTDIPPKEAIPGLITQLKAGIRKIDQNRQKIDKALPKLNQGLAKAKDGLRKLNDASAKLIDARGTLKDLKELAAIQADAMQVPVELARARLSQTELTAPVAGVVVTTADVGDQLVPGAPVVTIREDRPSAVTAWLSPGQLERVCVGDHATITGDWMSGAGVPATLSRISTRAEYPPTSVTTDEVHLTRAIQVEFTATERLPAGVPAEISITGCRQAADSSDQNR